MDTKDQFSQAPTCTPTYNTLGWKLTRLLQISWDFVPHANAMFILCFAMWEEGVELEGRERSPYCLWQSYVPKFEAQFA